MLKRSTTKISYIICIHFILLATPTFAAEVSGKVIGYSCRTCHSTNGQSSKTAIPNIKFQAADTTAKKLLEFKYDKQTSTIMGRIAKGYTDAELKAVAQYFSRLE